MKMNFPDALYDFKSQWKSADKFWQFGTGQYNPWRIALIEVLALRKVKVNSPFKTKDVSIFFHSHSSLSTEPRAASGVCAALCHPVTESPMLLSAPLTSLRCEAQPICKPSVHLALTQSSCLEICSGLCSVRVRCIWRIVLCVTLLPFLRSLQSPAHVCLRRASSLWTCEAVLLHTGLSLPCSSLSVTLCSGRDRRLRPYPCGLIFSTGAFPILYLLPSWCSRCARSCTVQVPSEHPCLLDWLTEFLDLLVRTLTSVLEEKQRQLDFNSLLRCHFWVFPDHTVVFSQAKMSGIHRFRGICGLTWNVAAVCPWYRLDWQSAATLLPSLMTLCQDLASVCSSTKYLAWNRKKSH